MKMMNKFISSVIAVSAVFSIPAVSAETVSTIPETNVESTPVTSVISSEVVEEKTFTIDAADITPESATESVDSPPSGNGKLIEEALDGNVNREFLTIQSKNGRTFYIIVDKDDNGGENVYFMNLVDEYDLMAFAEDFPEEIKEELEAGADSSDDDDTPAVTKTADHDEPDTPSVNKPDSHKNLIILLTGLLILGGAAFYFFRVKGKSKISKKDNPDIDDDEYEDEEDNEE